MGTGSDELLNLAAQAFAGNRATRFCSHRYGFSVYEIAARRCGATPVIAPDRDYAADVDVLLGCVRPKARVLFIARSQQSHGQLSAPRRTGAAPCQPTGNVLLVVDQAYAEYLLPMPMMALWLWR